MYENLALLAGFVLLYSTVAGAIERTWISGAIVFTGFGLLVGPLGLDLLTWETDANDVDFHIFDAKGGHAYYSSKRLPSGGELYEDITNGYAPECFTIPGRLPAAPDRLKMHYYSRGPMGYGMGSLDIVRHDGKGNLVFESRPYVVMNDSAYVDLGTVKRL